MKYPFSLTQDVLKIASAFIQYQSITPHDDDMLRDLHDVLEKEGWTSFLCTFDDTKNLYARIGHGEPHLCFAGHIDVVPPGPLSHWKTDPFAPTIVDGYLYGRGTADMKAPIAAFLAACTKFLSHSENQNKGTISILLTSDEEGPGINGIPKMIPWMQERGEKPTVILIGEPTGAYVGEVLQVGRRGSVVGNLEVLGKQGHIACPELADNPLPRMVTCLSALMQRKLDEGTEFFPPSKLELTSIDTGNPVENLIPSSSRAKFGTRFNTEHKGTEIMEWITKECTHHAGEHNLHLRLSGEPFLTKDETWISCVISAMKAVLKKSSLSDDSIDIRCTTQGGTTDGRFLTHVAPVLELGMAETTIHQANECISIDELYRLENIYLHILEIFFKAP